MGLIKLLELVVGTSCEVSIDCGLSPLTTGLVLSKYFSLSPSKHIFGHEMKIKVIKNK